MHSTKHRQQRRISNKHVQTGFKAIKGSQEEAKNLTLYINESLDPPTHAPFPDASDRLQGAANRYKFKAEKDTQLLLHQMFPNHTTVK